MASKDIALEEIQTCADDQTEAQETTSFIEKQNER